MVVTKSVPGCPVAFPSSKSPLAPFTLDRATFKPSFLRLVDLNGKDSDTFRFTSIVRDASYYAKNFEGRLVKGWKVVDFVGPSPLPAALRRQAAPPITSTPSPRR
jgi:hypothetical protein